jgi:hypothetical protein
MANDIASELDTMKNKIEFARAMAAYQSMEEQMLNAELHRRIVTYSLERLAQKGIYTFEPQSDRVAQQLAIALAQGNMAGVQRLQREIEKLEKWGLVSSELRREQMFLSDQIASIKIKLLNAKIDMKGEMPVKFVIENAIAPDKKFYPKKLIISFLSALGAFIVTLMSLLFIEKIRKEINLEPTNSNKQE